MSLKESIAEKEAQKNYKLLYKFMEDNPQIHPMEAIVMLTGMAELSFAIPNEGGGDEAVSGFIIGTTEYIEGILEAIEYKKRWKVAEDDRDNPLDTTA